MVPNTPNVMIFILFIFASQKQALQLRYLQTLKEVAGEKTNTIIFPLPLDLIEPFMNLGKALRKDQ